MQRACNALRLCMGAIAAARITAVVQKHAGKCHAALQVVGAQLHELRAVLKQRRTWDTTHAHAPDDAGSHQTPGTAAFSSATAAAAAEGKRSSVARSIKKALSGLQEPFESCLELLDECLQGQQGGIDDETVCYLMANIDSLYYTLLDHHLTAGECFSAMQEELLMRQGCMHHGAWSACLTHRRCSCCAHHGRRHEEHLHQSQWHACFTSANGTVPAPGWPTPSVPAPHHYFPCMSALLGDELHTAVGALRQRAGASACAAYQEAWDLDEAFHLPDDADPFRQVRPIAIVRHVALAQEFHACCKPGFLARAHCVMLWNAFCIAFSTW